MPDFNGIFAIRNWSTNQRLFDRARSPSVERGSHIPCGWCDHLVIFDFTVIYLNPVAKCAADGFGCPPALAVFFRRFDEPLIIEFKFPQHTFCFAIEFAQFVHPRKMSQGNGGATHLTIHIQYQRIGMLP